jgi:L-seryl-tRNA(Ser) seleniumtransferase
VEPNAHFRQLPSVDELSRALSNLEGRFPRTLIVAECRRVLQAAREAIQSKQPVPHDLASRAVAALESLEQPSLQRVINATGVILHTNLGRAPLAAPPSAGSYSNLEYDLDAGKRGKRDVHTNALLESLLEAPGILVNNGAAAVFLALHELARGGEVIVSRGELIEIGDGFRIPDIMARSGARLVEVGATNKTRIEDYANAIGPETRLLMRVHPSNFRMVGFTGRPSLEELVALGRERGIPVYEDLGSGCLADLSAWGVHEPTAQASLCAGVDVVSFSGDKLLGGPQAGVLAGRAELIAKLRRNPRGGVPPESCHSRRGGHRRGVDARRRQHARADLAGVPDRLRNRGGCHGAMPAPVEARGDRQDRARPSADRLAHRSPARRRRTGGRAAPGANRGWRVEPV